MEKFNIHILGCGSALPTTRHQATSQVLNIREKLFMIDCGEGAQVQLRRAKLKFSRLNHIFISHLHGDHCFGLMGLISTFGMLERTADLHIHAHADLQRLLEPQLEFFCKGMPYQVVFHPFNPGRTYGHLRRPFRQRGNHSPASSSAHLRFSLPREADTEPHPARHD